MWEAPGSQPGREEVGTLGERDRQTGDRFERRTAQEVDDLGPVLARLLPDAWDGAFAEADQGALDRAVRSAWLVAYHRARRRVADRAEAEEVAQEVFLRVLLRLSGSDGAVDVEVRTGYLVRSTQNLLADRWRARARHRDADARYAEGRSTAPELPEEHVVRAEEHADVRRALVGLSRIQRDVLRLRVLEGLTSEETAAVVGKTAAAVRQVQHRALTLLRRALEEGRP